MGIQISVLDIENGEFHSWWLNFNAKVIVKEHRAVYSLLSTEEVNNIFSPWNVKDVPKSQYIEFDTEKDLTLFLLRWG